MRAVALLCVTSHTRDGAVWKRVVLLKQDDERRPVRHVCRWRFFLSLILLLLLLKIITCSDAYVCLDARENGYDMYCVNTAQQWITATSDWWGY